MTFPLSLLLSFLFFIAPSVFGTEKKAPAEHKMAPAEAPAAKGTSTEKVGVKLTELFGTEETPGTGTIGYSVGQQLQQIALGKESGVYALGLVFEGLELPAAMRKSKIKPTIIQMAIGFNRGKIGSQVPQFAAMTILGTEKPIKLKKTYPLVVPNPTDRGRNEMAFLLFTPPTTPAERTDEDKLKSTFFANKGMISLTPQGEEQTIEAKRNGERLKFAERFMEAEIDGTLATPFHTEPGKIQAKFKFPLYWPSNDAAKKLVRRMAQDSLDGASVEKATGRAVAGE